jgi:uncharacterized membrane protein required for colicin V production
VAPIELFFGVLVLVFALIGLVRGFLRELGVTTVMMFALFVLHLFEPFLDQGVTRVMAMGDGLVEAQSQSGVQTGLFVIVIAVIAFISYAGETLSFAGESPRGPLGIILGALIGGLNGYLIAGSVWYYLHKWDYAIAWMGFSSEQLSETAQSLVEFMPIAFLGQPFLLGQSLLLYLAALLIIARVIR